MFSPQSSQVTDAVDQAALVAIWNGFTSKGSLNWNTTASLCAQNVVTCTSAGKVIFLYKAGGRSLDWVVLIITSSFP